MKNVIHPVPASDLRAKTAVQKIQKWVEENYPRLAAVTKAKLIIECLIELKEERRHIAANN